MSDLVEAIWRGPFDGETARGILVRPGDVALVTERDLDSGHWEPVNATATPEPPAEPAPEPTFLALPAPTPTTDEEAER